tara:strand:- start:3758 stop:3985 length:228 start_codon:yes stop_codon:yes gene_type:complete
MGIRNNRDGFFKKQGQRYQNKKIKKNKKKIKHLEDLNKIRRFNIKKFKQYKEHKEDFLYSSAEVLGDSSLEDDKK